MCKRLYALEKLFGRLCFFHIVRCAPNKLIRQTVEDEVPFDAADIVIAPHRVLHADAAKNEVIVDCAAVDWLHSDEKQPFVLSLQSFSCEQLLQIFKWSSDDRLSYGIWGCDAEITSKLSPGDRNVLPSVIEDVLARHGEDGYLLDQRGPGTEGWQHCLASLADAGLLDRVSSDARFSKWRLRDSATQRRNCLKRPLQPLALQDDVKAPESSVWQLIALLDAQGWTHVVKDTGKDDPYVPGTDSQGMV